MEIKIKRTQETACPSLILRKQAVKEGQNVEGLIVEGLIVEGLIVPVLSFPALSATGIVEHGFSTRIGGVSTGVYSTLNFSVPRGDAPENVAENFRRIGAALGTDPEHMVLSHQIHKANVLRVDEKDAGKGTVRELTWDDADGLVTNTPGLTLVTFFADCVPVMFVDPVHRAIGSCHSGWRGTVLRISRNVLLKMKEEFGTAPSDVYCAIGPSICRSCYEISDEVADEFRKEFPGHEHELLFDVHGGHAHLDLWEACRLTLLEAGVPAEHISVTDICTACNPDLLFSHRAAKGQHGLFCGFIRLL
ncbi:MAG: peptidoglycan editing factor PgeF [Lachnospiraceae bacterium]|nr:peptidoglycan editing factor PgeF [Lachnospiraceae bacterium]